jgi:tetratricopeptide (TPR) repeat protein
MLGRAYCNTGNISAAVTELDTAIFLDTGDYEAYSFRASIHESMEETDDAIICYRKAISHGCEDVDVQRSLAYLLSNKEDYSGALKMMSNVVDDESVNVSDVILYGDLARFCGDHAAVTKAVNKFLLLNAGIEETVSFARIVEEAGHPDDAKRILSSDDEPIRMSPSLKKSAEKAMRYAFSTGMSPFDPDLYENCGLNINESEAIMEYLNDIPDYGEIDESSPDFELMELRSMDVILKCGLTELEDGVIPIDRLFTKGGFKDLDSAKEVYSYIRAAVSSNVDSDDPELINMAMQVPADVKLYDIIDQMGVGIYSAVAIKTMATR